MYCAHKIINKTFIEVIVLKCFKMLVCTMLCVALLCACKNEIPQNASSVNSKTEAPESVLRSENVYSSLDNKLIAWGLKKNKGQKPDVPDSIVKLLDENDAFYLSKSGKNLYLTFDEGYENGYSAQILDVLKQSGTPAAFFITGDYLKNEPELVKRMVDEGHIVGNHTKNHPSMPSVTNLPKIVEEITGLDDEFYALTGKHMKYIRPPKGEFSERTLAISKDLGYKTVFWSFAYADWERGKVNGAQYAYEHVMPYLHDGAVILLHAVSKDNADALSQIIIDARAKGYTFKSLDEI